MAAALTLIGHVAWHVHFGSLADAAFRSDRDQAIFTSAFGLPPSVTDVAHTIFRWRASAEQGGWRGRF